MAEYIEREAAMDIREKLVDLLHLVHVKVADLVLEDNEKTYSDAIGMEADHLIANGVTVQEWISVKEKLPEIVSTHKGYRSTIKKSIRVLCVCVQKSGKTMVKEGYCEWYNDYPEPRWQIPGTIDNVTHWQYLPQPPKGE